MEKLFDQFIGSLPVGVIILVYLAVIHEKIKDTCRRVGKLENTIIDHLQIHVRKGE